MRCSGSLFTCLLFCVVTAMAADESQVQALEAKCEQAREVRLKPTRDAEIAKCKASKPDDPQYCERYWRDYGNAVRQPNGTFRPRLFADLPECVAADKARRELRLNPP